METIRNLKSQQEANECKDMANYILRIIRGQKPDSETNRAVTTFGLSQRNLVYFSWGAVSPKAIVSENNSFGLQIKVNGRLFKGLVRIWYDYGMDLFNIEFLKNSGKTLQKTIEGIYLDNLQEVIDETIETRK